MKKYLKPSVEVIEFAMGDNSLGNLCSTGAGGTEGGMFTKDTKIVENFIDKLFN